MAEPTQAASRSNTEPHIPTALGSTRAREEPYVTQQGEGWSSDGLRGYAALSRDETAGQDEDWQHLNQERGQERVEELDPSTPRSSQASRRQSPASHHTSRSSKRKVDDRDALQRRATGPNFSLPSNRSVYPVLGVQNLSEHVYESVDQEWDGSWTNLNTNYAFIPLEPPEPQGSVDFNIWTPYHNPNENGFTSGSASNSVNHRVAQSHNWVPKSPPRPMAPTSTSPAFPMMRPQRNTSTMTDQLNALREENERLRQGNKDTQFPAQPAVFAYTGRVFHQVGQTIYLSEPRWEPTEGSSVLLCASNPIRKIEYYLDQHPEIAFAIYKEYDQTPPADRTKIETTDGVYRSPRPSTEYLRLITTAMLDAIDELIRHLPKFGDYFPYFEPEKPIAAPHLFMYYSAPFISEILPKLGQLSQNLITQLQAAINKSHGYEYRSAKLQAEKGKVARHLVKYLVRPGDVLIKNYGNDSLQAYIATDWIESPELSDEDSEYGEGQERKKKIPRYGPLAGPAGSRELTTYRWEVPVWRWDFDGVFAKDEASLTISMTTSYDEESVWIETLSAFPIKYASPETRSLLERRGKTFWSIRHRRFILYMQSGKEDQHNIGDRHMVDTEAYKTLFPTSWIARSCLKDDVGTSKMASDRPADGDSLLLFPPTIMGYNLQEKAWRTLYVDRITDVVWNKQAFRDLVAEPETKELVQALVMKQIDTKKSTDFVTGKGNGLIMLLHGAPGTGKTFTAEGVAEFAEKPLLRVTCGDIGTLAEVVDQRLRATFKLGKMWDCVVLLDEADVFLEDRDTKDLNRNALVSVFLRALEYYDGILILTSNCVGNFDEAFKSRIQLALHYENLGEVQRKKIWRNFLNRLKLLEDESEADVDDISDHISDLSKRIMNGREIRNAITIGRQLAQFRRQRFQYAHLKHAIDVGSRFGEYLQHLHMNLTDDAIKQDSGVRYSYTAVPAGLE